MIKRPTIKFHGSKDDPGALIDRAISRLHFTGVIAYYKKNIQPGGLLHDEETCKNYVAKRNENEEALLADLAKFADRARKPWDMEGVLAILDERVRLVDLDGVFTKIGKTWHRNKATAGGKELP